MGKLKKMPVGGINAALSVHIILLFLVWTLREIFLKPAINGAFPPLTAELLGGGIKLLVWTLPAYYLMRHYRDGLRFSFGELMRAPVQWGKLCAVLGGMAVYQLAGALIRFGKIGVHKGFDPADLIGTVLVVGLTEEIVFRGWLLNALLPKMPEQAAVALSSALFVLIHFPIWATKGYFGDAFTLFSAIVMVSVLSLLFSYAFLKTKNLVFPSVIHMFWNLLVLVLIGS